MPWSRFDDKFHDHAKILALSHRAFRLFVCSVTYCRAHSTRGHLTPAQAQALARQQRVGYAAISELVEKGGWENNGNGYVVHDYEDYNPNDETAAARMKKFRSKKK